MDGIKGFLQKDTAGMPNWVWLIVVAGGIAAAYFIPKFMGKNSSTDTSSTDTSGQGLGLAIDPTTGLPYAVEGLVPSGAGAGGGGGSSSEPPPPPTTTPPGGGNPPPPKPPPAHRTFKITADFKKQHGGHTLHAIAEMFGISYDALYEANKKLLGPDKNHAKYKVGDVLTIPTATPPKSPILPPGPGGPVVSPRSTVWPGGTTQVRVA